jgi:diguanylate cyclase (GGDEF)-like protein/PAS domain S-box-containing protein
VSIKARLEQLDRWSSYRFLLASALLTVSQATTLRIISSTSERIVVSESIQFVLGLLCVAACVDTFRRSTGTARYAWRVLTGSFVLWLAGQTLSIYMDLSGRTILESVDDGLFFSSVIPFGMLPFLDPEGEPNSFDRIHILDFIQILIFWITVYLFFSPRIWSAESAASIGPFVWSRNFVFDLVLLLTMLLRGALGGGNCVRQFFLRMSGFLVLSGLADCYALNPKLNVQPGGWFDLIWSALLTIPILIAATWTQDEYSSLDRSNVWWNIIVSQFFPLFYPLLSFCVLTLTARSYPALSVTLFAVAFVAFAGRVLVIQSRLRKRETQLLIDAEKHRRTEEALRRSEVEYRLLFLNNPIPMWLFDPSTLRFLAVNEATIRQYGYSEQEFMSMTIADIRPPEDVPTLLEFTATPAKGLQDGTQWRHRKKDGTIINVEIVSHELNFRGMDTELIAAYDVTARTRAEDQVRTLAYYDSLTGLPNRTLLKDRLGQALAAGRRRNEMIALLFLDLDRFKIINDSLGHSFGDVLLQGVAERLKKCSRAQDTVARIGGDEFLVVLTGVRDIGDVAVAAQRIMDVMTIEFNIQDRRFTVSCSMGISVYPEHGADIETLVKNADAALYSAKEGGRNNFRFFTEQMNAKVVERLTIEHKLHVAVQNRELFVVYQPQVEIRSGAVIGMEALLRWQQPEMGLVPPSRFIPIAENSGLIIPIGEWVLRTVCATAREWQEKGLRIVPVSVNVSAIQFRHDGFCELVSTVLRETGLNPEFLELELTESVLLQNADLTLPLLRDLNRMGIKLVIDDFGTGYSSLSYLKQFPVSRLKIDCSFIRDVATDSDDAAITSAIIGLGKSLNLRVIAEGVENEQQMAFLRAHRCDEVQGYYFSEPLAADQMQRKLVRECVSLLHTQAGEEKTCGAAQLQS